MKVCIHCFNDEELKQFILSNSVESGICDYCRDETTTDLIEIDELLDFFAEFLAIFNEDTHGIPLVELIQQDWNLFSAKPESIIVLSDILKALNYPLANLDIDVNYIDEITECTSYWDTLKKSIKWNKRFLIDIDRLEELGWDRFFAQKVILSKTDPLYRARLHFDGDQNLFDCENMGCPDKSIASAGRANPQGIPYLYLCKSIETTLYEIRASYLDEISVGTFNITNNSEIQLVDFTELTSAFRNIDGIKEYAKSMLLKNLISADLSKPMRRYDSELEYIPTQFICEYIRVLFTVDGIQFGSSLHDGGINIVLFEQDKVECTSVEMHRIMDVKIASRNIVA